MKKRREKSRINGSILFKFFKPSILSRYIIKEQFPPMILGIMFFTFVLVVNKVVLLLSLLIEKNVPIRFGIELFLLMLPFTLALTIPIAILIGTVMAMGRLSANSEIVAMRASGISYYRIYRSLFIMGTIYTVFLIWFNNYILPFSNNRFRILHDEIYDSQPVGLIEKGVFHSMPGDRYTIYVQSIDKKQDLLKDIIIYKEKEKENEGRDIILAKEGKWLSTKGDMGYKTLRLFRGSMHIGNRLRKSYTIVDFSEKYMDINLREQNISGKNATLAKSEREKSISESFHDMEKFKREIWSKYLAQHADQLALSLAGKSQIEKMPRLYSANEERELAYRELEFWKHFTIPLACLALTLIGAPLGIVSHRSGRGMGLGFAVVIAFAYYLIMMTGERSARALKIPSIIGAWLPVVLISIIGIVVIYFRNQAESMLEALLEKIAAIRKFFSRGKLGPQ